MFAVVFTAALAFGWEVRSRKLPCSVRNHRGECRLQVALATPLAAAIDSRTGSFARCKAVAHVFSHRAGNVTSGTVHAPFAGFLLR